MLRYAKPAYEKANQASNRKPAIGGLENKDAI